MLYFVERFLMRNMNMRTPLMRNMRKFYCTQIIDNCDGYENIDTKLFMRGIVLRIFLYDKIRLKYRFACRCEGSAWAVEIFSHEQHESHRGTHVRDIELD